MPDRISAIAAAQAATPYVRPNALIFTVEGGRHVLHVAHGKEEARRIFRERRAETREERYVLAHEVVEGSLLPERSDAPIVTVVSPVVQILSEAVFELMPHLETFQSVVYEDARRVDAFVLPYAPEVEAGFGVVRLEAGPELRILHSYTQATAFLKLHEGLMEPDQLKEAYDDFGYRPIAARSKRPSAVFGGFAAALIGARYRLRWLMKKGARR